MVTVKNTKCFNKPGEIKYLQSAARQRRCSMQRHWAGLALVWEVVGHQPGCSSSKMQLWEGKAEADGREYVPSLSCVSLPAEQNHSEGFFCKY